MKKEESTPKHLYDFFINKKVKVYLNDPNTTELIGVLNTERQFELLLECKVKDKEGVITNKMRLILKQSILYMKEI
ncbi:hypothetical protein [Staphylococcus simulans]|uniref:hypothetical protein n=1 Tax=Staphylococcus simulans TaxID=1286 RepID=UPI000D09DC96|nr:hypothetical protein [Staphylococcus simulans]AVO06371.1 hypothetical protein BI283_13350 [Staphylococcus simulans]AWI02913.1 hypothetical protein A7X73_13225 [Staphylococcus simulans]